MQISKNAIPLILVLFSGISAHAMNFELPSKEKFRQYWFNSGAELSRYKLQQSRYGEVHNGDAVLIFVTEEFNPELLVKADQKRKNNVPILKLNSTRKFYTGIYPYSTMTSTFSPLDLKKFPLPLKNTTSVQDWCGMVYNQMNLKGSGYSVESRSYFESESDKNFNLPSVQNEDGIMNIIRIDPNRLPSGNFDIIPSTLFTRLAHKPLVVTKATGTLKMTDQKSLEGIELVMYTIKYTDVKRTVNIFFEKEFPFRIQKWEEIYPGIMGSKTLTTTAVRSHTLKSAYWGKHKNKDRVLLKKLGLRPNT